MIDTTLILINSSTRDEPDVSGYKSNVGPKQWFHTKPRRGIMTAASKKKIIILIPKCLFEVFECTMQNGDYRISLAIELP